VPNPKKKIADREQDLRSLCRSFTNASIKRLGGYVTAVEGVEDDIRLRAIGMLLDRGWGKPNQPHDAKLEGELRITIRKLLSDDDEKK
jgi:hypothetical protein